MINKNGIQLIRKILYFLVTLYLHNINKLKSFDLYDTRNVDGKIRSIQAPNRTSKRIAKISQLHTIWLSSHSIELGELGEECALFPFLSFRFVNALRIGYNVTFL